MSIFLTFIHIRPVPTGAEGSDFCCMGKSIIFILGFKHQAPIHGDMRASRYCGDGVAFLAPARLALG
jgi:hypothetical protein